MGHYKAAAYSESLTLLHTQMLNIGLLSGVALNRWKRTTSLMLEKDKGKPKERGEGKERRIYKRREVGERVERQDGRKTNLRFVLHEGAPKCTGVEGKLQLNLESKCDTHKRERGKREEKRERRGERRDMSVGRERELKEKEERERERRK